MVLLKIYSMIVYPIISYVSGVIPQQLAPKEISDLQEVTQVVGVLSFATTMSGVQSVMMTGTTLMLK